MKTPKCLSFWENVDVDLFRKWCGDYTRAWKAKIRQEIAKKQHKTVLDVGAGVFSEYYGFIADQINIDYTATEITEKFVKLGADLGLNVYHCSVSLMPFSDGSFDVVLCNDVLNHQQDFRDEIRELVRVAKKQVIVSFFKPFIETPAGRTEVIHACRQFASKNVPGVGVSIDRMKNGENETTCIYTYFSLDAMSDFLDTLPGITWEMIEHQKIFILLIEKS